MEDGDWPRWKDGMAVPKSRLISSSYCLLDGILVGAEKD